MNGVALLLDTITNPEVTHIDSFTVFNIDRLMNNALLGVAVSVSSGSHLGC